MNVWASTVRRWTRRRLAVCARMDAPTPRPLPPLLPLWPLPFAYTLAHSRSPAAAELVEAERSLKLVEQAASSQQALLGTLDEAMASAYSAAESALGAGDEVGARSRLEERQALKGKRALAEAQWREAEARVASMRSNVASLAERASRIEAAISRTVTSAASREGRSAPPSAAPLEMEPEDPLLRKFRDLEGK